mmetsp:Transcript_78412/g.216737  ORF Transcript_78412/g.216737 Transcript_78412/m.216737 type:complete len:209 (+) Transcript_78412:1184-1810(+)
MPTFRCSLQQELAWCQWERLRAGSNRPLVTLRLLRSAGSPRMRLWSSMRHRVPQATTYGCPARTHDVLARARLVGSFCIVEWVRRDGRHSVLRLASSLPILAFTLLCHPSAQSSPLFGSPRLDFRRCPKLAAPSSTGGCKPSGGVSKTAEAAGSCKPNWEWEMRCRHKDGRHRTCASPSLKGSGTSSALKPGGASWTKWKSLLHHLIC